MTDLGLIMSHYSGYRCLMHYKEHVCERLRLFSFVSFYIC